MVPKLKQGEGQDRNVYNGVKRVLRDISKLTDDQLAVLHYEAWHEAYMRSGKRIQEVLSEQQAG